MEYVEVKNLFPDVSRETFDRVTLYVELCKKWNKTINLVAPDSLSVIWQRHVFDSLQLLSQVQGNARSIVDIGSGGGFPGMILALATYDPANSLQVILVDSDRRKCEFLKTVARMTGIVVDIRTDRIEAVPSLAVDIVTARGFAPLDQLLNYAHLHLAPNGTALFLKGAKVETEISKARIIWNFELETFQSVTHPQASILKIGGISRV